MPPRAQRIKAAAEDDTPANVHIPDGYLGIATWALGRFGVGAIFILSTWLLYSDQRIINQQIMNFQMERLKVDLEMTRTMASLREAVLSVGADAKSAHETTQRQFNTNRSN